LKEKQNIQPIFETINKTWDDFITRREEMVEDIIKKDWLLPETKEK